MGVLSFSCWFDSVDSFSIRLDTIDASTYGESAFPTTETKINRQFKTPIENKHVLVIDDIADTGSTLKKSIG